MTLFIQKYVRKNRCIVVSRNIQWKNEPRECQQASFCLSGANMNMEHLVEIRIQMSLLTEKIVIWSLLLRNLLRT